eukprot:11038976-Alexandrium_andersonii.AAC.1
MSAAVCACASFSSVGPVHDDAGEKSAACQLDFQSRAFQRQTAGCGARGTAGGNVERVVEDLPRR